jgi:phage shock protein A
MAEAETIAKELEAIRRQKDKLKAAANPGAAESKRETDDPRVSDVEKRFRKMESESELEGLKDRIRREFGE